MTMIINVLSQLSSKEGENMRDLEVVVPAEAEAVRVSFVAQLVSTASHFVSDITIKDERNSIDLKSIMGMMTLVFNAGKMFTITINGEDEDLAAETISDLFLDRGI